MKLSRIFIATAVLLCCVSPRAFSEGGESTAHKQILSFYNDNYALIGPSLRTGEFDIKFQLSIKVYPVTINHRCFR